MPLYEYHCDACGEEFTELQAMSAPKTGAKCPHCGSTNTRRIVSTFASKSGSSSPGSLPGGGCLPGG